MAQEHENVRLRRQATQEAIALAMEGRWQEAISANKAILESFPGDVEAYNRLGRAYMELREFDRAKEAYGQTLAIDPLNVIAKRNLERLAHVEKSAPEEAHAHKVEPDHFIEEVGKAGVVNLYHLAPARTLAKLVAGDVVSLRADGASLAVEDTHGDYVGRVEPKHAQRLVRLMGGGNRYSAAILNSAEDRISVVIREDFQHPSQAGKLSFPPPKGFEMPRAYVSERMLRHEVEGEETAQEPGYTIVGGEGEETEVLPEDSAEADENEEE